MRHLLSIDDLTDDEILAVLDRADAFATGAAVPRRAPTVGLVFLTASLRTRIGFTVATQRLGGQAVVVAEPRWDVGMSAPESFGDTLRTVSGMVEVVVCRTGERLDADRAVAPVVNAGDAHGHPTQALIDLATMQRERGAVDQLDVALVGDLTQRSARSLLQLFRRFPPRSLVLAAPPGRVAHGVDLGVELESRTTLRSPDDLGDVDIVSMTGCAPGPVPTASSEADRLAHVLTVARVERLPPDCVVLSPLPLVDEIDDDARRDPRVRVWAQSDGAVDVRMAIVELAASWA